MASSYTSTALITGGSSGLGLSLALQLSPLSPTTQIVVASRTPPPAADIANLSEDNITYIPLDLSTHAGTRTFAAAYLARSFPPISALVLNAGYQHVPELQLSADGIEQMFATNHVNHTLLFFLLKSQLAPSARVVVVSSSTHDPSKKRVPPPTFTTGEAAAHPPSGKEYDVRDEANRRYALSKLANMLFAYALHARAQKAGKDWVVLAYDPGVMPTKLYRWATGVSGWAFNAVLASSLTRYLIADLWPTEVSAKTLLRLVIAPEYGLKEKSGKYFQVEDGLEIESSVQSHDTQCQDELWRWTVQEVAQDDRERAQFERL